VRTGYPRGAQVEIVDGLEDADEIVVLGQAGLRDGARVDVVRRTGSRLARDGN
jgi:membrane fusion protein, multidrug efflux system